MADRVRLADIRERADLVRGLNASPVTADAIADRESMLAALNAVLALHVPVYDDESEGWVCRECREYLGPKHKDRDRDCPTVRAIESVIDLGDEP